MPNWIVSKQNSEIIAINRATREIALQHTSASHVLNKLIAKAAADLSGGSDIF